MASPALAQQATQGSGQPAPATVAPLPAAAPAATDQAAPAGAAAAGGSEADGSEAAPRLAAPSPGPEDLDAATDRAEAEVTATLPHDLSPWGMFMAADIVVKGVMAGLALASVLTWTIWLAKSIELFAARRRDARAAALIGRALTLSEAQSVLGRGRGPARLFLDAAQQELLASAAIVGRGGPASVKERVASRLSRIEARAGRRMGRGTGLLATIGSTAPFVGLFGTVWGIMNAFIGISRAQTTNLAVVAPGIAEALLATAIGLVAAIPAVVIYNAFARATTGYRHVLADAAAGVERLVSRDLDFMATAPRAPAGE